MIDKKWLTKKAFSAWGEENSIQSNWQRSPKIIIFEKMELDLIEFEELIQLDMACSLSAKVPEAIRGLYENCWPQQPRQ